MDNLCDTLYCFSGAWQYKPIFICKKNVIAQSQLFAFHKRKIILSENDENFEFGWIIYFMLLMLIYVLRIQINWIVVTIKKSFGGMFLAW